MMKGTTIDFGSKKTISYDGTDFSSEGRFKLNGAGSTSSKSIKITATSAGKLRFCCQSASGSDSSRTWSISKAGEDPIQAHKLHPWDILGRDVERVASAKPCERGAGHRLRPEPKHNLSVGTVRVLEHPDAIRAQRSALPDDVLLGQGRARHG